MPFVYMLRCGDGSLYAGAAKNLARRLAQHRAGTASAYTRSHLPVTLAWSRRVRGWSDALKAEHRIKQLSKKAKEALVAEMTKKAREEFNHQGHQGHQVKKKKAKQRNK